MFNDYDSQLLDDTYVKIKSLTAQLEEAKENQRIAIEALEFYANEDNWKTGDTYDERTGIALDVILCSKVQAQGNKKAEKALSTIRGK